MRCFVILGVILGTLCLAAQARADDRSEARTHYQAGLKSYSGGDYRGAIREFSAAQQLVPADLNNYNLALCYDKLGDAEPAIQYYRAFLDKQPGTDKRVEIEASINRLEAASRSAAKKAEEARRADEAKRAAGPVLGPAPPPAPVAGPVAGPVPAPAPVAGPPPPPAAGPPAPPSASTSSGTSGDDRRPSPSGPAVRAPGPATAGSIGTPSTATPVGSGDAQLDRANAINIDDIRDQRVGAGAGGPVEGRSGPAVAAGAGGLPREGRSGPAVAAADNPPPGSPPLAPNGQPGGSDQPRPETPVYKKWWFWGVVVVAGFVVYELATTSSQPSQTARQVPPGKAAPDPGGLTLLRW